MKIRLDQNTINKRKERKERKKKELEEHINRLEKNGPEEALRQLISHQHHDTLTGLHKLNISETSKKIVAEELKKKRESCQIRRDKKARKHEKQAELKTELEQTMRETVDRLATATGHERIRLLASMPYRYRKKVTTPEDEKLVLTLRENSLTLSDLRKTLKATKSEINTWDQDGRLPHLFKGPARDPVSNVKRLSRYWTADDILHALSHISEWRMSDREKRLSEENPSTPTTEI